MPSSGAALEELQAVARKFQARAYAPYSGFFVGAVLVTGDGHTFGGSNVENASYGLTICAERSAAVSAVSAGYRDFAEIVIVGPEGVAVTPCGACRQFLSEFNPAMRVHCTSPQGIISTTIEQLLPGAFGPSDLT